MTTLTGCGDISTWPPQPVVTRNRPLRLLNLVGAQQDSRALRNAGGVEVVDGDHVAGRLRLHRRCQRVRVGCPRAAVGNTEMAVGSVSYEPSPPP